jgi:hypothetical protein
MISYTFDHSYAGDLASLGIEYLSLSNDYEIEVIESVNHEYTDYLMQHADAYYRIN